MNNRRIIAKNMILHTNAAYKQRFNMECKIHVGGTEILDNDPNGQFGIAIVGKDTDTGSYNLDYLETTHEQAMEILKNISRNYDPFGNPTLPYALDNLESSRFKEEYHHPKSKYFELTLQHNGKKESVVVPLPPVLEVISKALDASVSRDNEFCLFSEYLNVNRRKNEPEYLAILGIDLMKKSAPHGLDGKISVDESNLGIITRMLDEAASTASKYSEKWGLQINELYDAVSSFFKKT